MEDDDGICKITSPIQYSQRYSMINHSAWWFGYIFCSIRYRVYLQNFFYI